MGRGVELAGKLRGFGPLGILAILVIIMLGPLPGAILVLAWASLSRTPWGEIGFVRPSSWIATVALGLVLASRSNC